MAGLLLDWYPWIKGLHVIAVIAWMAGMLYLPRLFVYHAEVAPESPESALFKVMERRLLRAIINPAMIASFVLGGLLLAVPGLIDWGQGWIWVKLSAVLALSAIHGCLARWRKAFERDANPHSARFYRVVNEVPTVLMIVIVIMVVVQPF